MVWGTNLKYWRVDLQNTKLQANFIKQVGITCYPPDVAMISGDPVSLCLCGLKSNHFRQRHSALYILTNSWLVMLGKPSALASATIVIDVWKGTVLNNLRAGYLKDQLLLSKYTHTLRTSLEAPLHLTLSDTWRLAVGAGLSPWWQQGCEIPSIERFTALLGIRRGITLLKSFGMLFLFLIASIGFAI